MSQAQARLTTAPRDGYETYYAEKLWSWLPEIYRTLDGEAPANGVLRALIELVAEKAAVLRRDIDRLWDDQAIELCDDWAVSYLGALVSVTPLGNQNPRGNRLAAGRAIAYQRRKGTPTVIQMAIRDIAEVDGVVVEAFRRLARFPHRLDSDAISYGAVTSTPSGGFANLRAARIASLTDTGFDELAHLPDPRRLRGPYGRYGLRNVNLHLYPYRSVQIDLPTPVRIDSGRFTLDPSGRDVPLFQRGQSSDRPPDQVREVDLPDAISCRRFNATSHLISAATLAVINDAGIDLALAPLLDRRFDRAASFRRNVEARLSAAQMATFYGALLDATLEADAPKAVLWGDSLALTQGAEHVDPPLPPSAILAANLGAWQTALTLETHVALAVDPATGRMRAGPALGSEPVFANRVHLGIFDAVGATGLRHEPSTLPSADSLLPAGVTGVNGGFTDAGPVAVTLPAPLTGTHRFTTSRTYEPALPAGRNFSGITHARLDASDGARPHVRFRPNAANLDITFTAAAAAVGETRTLEIDGLWIGMLAAAVVPELLADAKDAATPVLARLVLDGDFDTVTLRNATLDPGGERARATPTAAVAIPLIRLEIEGQVGKLLIERCITGPIWETNNDAALCNAGKIIVCDSIVKAPSLADVAIQTRLAHVSLSRCTVFGRVEVARLYASDSVLRGRTRVTDPQHGCFRYSSTSRDGAVLPRQFESFVPEGMLPAHWFRSQRFGEPSFAVLSATAPAALTRGAENGAEMGVFNTRALTLTLEQLGRQLRDLLPVGQTPQQIIEHAISRTEDWP
jgi:hypothetical protein